MTSENAILSMEELKALIANLVKEALAERMPFVSPAMAAESNDDAMDSFASIGLSKGPSFQRPGLQNQYNDLASARKSVDDTIVALERGFDVSVAIASAKKARSVLDKRMSQVILVDRVGSWSIVRKVCDNAAAFVTDPAAKKALEEFNSLQSRQFFQFEEEQRGSSASP